MGNEIPEKLYFRIGEVSRLLDLKPSVLRFWETEFSSLCPHKSRSGQRLYSREDIERLIEIKKLLYTEKLTIEGAKKRLKSKQEKLSCPVGDAQTLLAIVRNELKSLQKLLS